MISLPSGAQRWAIILMPPMALGVMGGLVIPKHNAVRRLDAENESTRKSIETYRHQIEELNKMPLYPRIASVPMSREEQSAFLRGLGELCRRTGNKLISITSLAPPVTPPPAPGGAPKPATPPADALPDGVVEIKSTLVFEGTFDTIRLFMAGIKRSARLVGLSSTRINPGMNGYPNLQISLTVVRYVDGPPTVQAAPKA